MTFCNRLVQALATAVVLLLGAASSASALPDISLTLEGATYPVHMSVTALTIKTKLTNLVKEGLVGEGVLIIVFLNELGHLGTYEALFTKVVNKAGTPCSSEEAGRKDPSGEVLSKGTWHLVYTSLAGSSQGLQLGVLALASPSEVVCGAEVVKVKGDELGSVQTLEGTEATEYDSGTGVLLGNAEGSPNIRFFYNEAGASVRTRLEVNFGSGFKEGDEELAEPTTSTTPGGKMVVITSR
jgi:hypothetical protein